VPEVAITVSTRSIMCELGIGLGLWLGNRDSVSVTVCSIYSKFHIHRPSRHGPGYGDFCTPAKCKHCDQFYVGVFLPFGVKT